MKNRREFAISLAAIFAGSVAAPARAMDAADQPAANLIPGHPDMLDFGDGLTIPMNQAALKTLWEDKSFWITYGMGVSDYTGKAAGFATTAAIGTMKLLLLTLAFEPRRLAHVYDCGWTLKDPAAKNYVIGDIAIPGKPFRPVNDANSSTADMSQVFAFSQNAMIAGNAQGAPTGAGGTTGVDMTGTNAKVHAVTGYMVWKRDVTLDYVRRNAQLL